jgi:hypothetical protein
MATKLPSAKITDLVTTVDSGVFVAPTGPMAWGTVEICYTSEGLEPKVTIKVPVPADGAQSEAQQRAETLRRARKLIDHACTAIQFLPEAAQETAQDTAQDPGEMLEGLAEELGIRAPATAPKSARRA